MKNADMPINAVYDPLTHTGEYVKSEGLTKREYFAGLAMQALLSDLVNADLRGYEVTSDQTAREAVAQADALLAELDKTK